MIVIVTRSYLTGQAQTCGQTLKHSLKVPRRATKCLVQARLVHPFLPLHGLPALPRCHVRSANHLSEYTEKAISRRDAEVAKKADTDFHRHTQIGFPFFESKESVFTLLNSFR